MHFLHRTKEENQILKNARALFLKEVQETAQPALEDFEQALLNHPDNPDEINRTAATLALVILESSVAAHNSAIIYFAQYLNALRPLLNENQQNAFDDYAMAMFDSGNVIHHTYNPTPPSSPGGVGSRKSITSRNNSTQSLLSISSKNSFAPLPKKTDKELFIEFLIGLHQEYTKKSNRSNTKKEIHATKAEFVLFCKNSVEALAPEASLVIPKADSLRDVVRVIQHCWIKKKDIEDLDHDIVETTKNNQTNRGLLSHFQYNRNAKEAALNDGSFLSKLQSFNNGIKPSWVSTEVSVLSSSINSISCRKSQDAKT